MNPDQLVQHVQSRYGGRVLDMQPVKTSQGDSYRVKLLQPSGKVKMLLIDSSSGDARSFGQGGSDKKGP